MKNALMIFIILLSFCVYFFIKGFYFSGSLATTRDNIFMYGSYDDIQDYLEKPNDGISVGSLYSLVDRNKPDILEMVLKNYNFSADLNAKKCRLFLP